MIPPSESCYLRSVQDSRKTGAQRTTGCCSLFQRRRRSSRVADILCLGAGNVPVSKLIRGTLLLLLWAVFGTGVIRAAQNCPDQGSHNSSLQNAFQSQDWTRVIRLAESSKRRSAEENFHYGMALAHLQRWPAAHGALLAGERQCPRDERFPVELAGVAFQQKQYSQAVAWLRRALKLNPTDQYANDFAGTVYYLM